MSQLIEFIESYKKIRNDYQWNDNHGELVRCKDCKHRKRCIKTMIIKSALGGEVHMPLDLDGNGYCSAGEREEE